MIKRIFSLGCLMLGFFFIGNSYSGSVKEVEEGKYIIENEYIEIKLNPTRGGG